MTEEQDDRLDTAAFHRNHRPIWAAMVEVLQNRPGQVLEVGSGSGQHIVEFAANAPKITWWPSDCGDRQLRSIAAWQRRAMLPNLRPPCQIDLASSDWQPPEAAAREGLLAIVCINVLHVAPWWVAENLFVGAARYLAARGTLLLYGPFLDHEATAPTNAAFDSFLRAENPDWGVRQLSDICSLAERSGLQLVRGLEMPANNRTLVLERAARRAQ